MQSTNVGNLQETPEGQPGFLLGQGSVKQNGGISVFHYLKNHRLLKTLREKSWFKISSHKEMNDDFFQFFSDLFKENQKLPKRYIVQYLNAINPPLITEEVFS